MRALDVADTVRRGWALKKQGNFLSGLDCANHALATDPHNLPANQLRAASLYCLERYEDAIAAYDRVLELNPKSVYVFRWKGNALKWLNRPAEALIQYEMARDSGDQSADLWCDQAQALYLLSRFEDASAACEHALYSESLGAWAWDLRGSALLELKRFGDALGAYDHAIAIKPRWTQALLNKDVALARVRRYADALACAERAIVLEPENLVAWEHKAYNLYHLRRYEEALAAYTEAHRLEPGARRNVVERARCLSFLGRFDDALAACDEAKALEPENAALGANCDLIMRSIRRDTVDQRLRLRDGRWLGYVEYGDPAGVPLMSFHGTPGSRLDRFPEKLARDLHLRVISPDRPGYGISTYKRGRRIKDWPDDVAELADHLGIDQFAVLGFSGGGPYALACAAKLPKRVTRVGLLSTATPMRPLAGGPDNKKLLLRELVTLLMPWPLRWVMTLLASWLVREKPAFFSKLAWASTAGTDREEAAAFNRATALRPVERESILEPVRQGGRGWAQDARLVNRGWGFTLCEIAAPVYLWHGQRDRLVPVEQARALAATIPQCQATYYRGEGHNAPTKHERDILTAMSTAPE